MSSHVYHGIYLHFNWHTKGDLPLLFSGELETLTHCELQDKCRRIKGAYLHGIGGTDTHVHLALSIEPFVTISELVQELKRASSFEVNKRMSRRALEWQRGYGAVSFGKRNLDWVLDYVRRRREHRANGRLQSRLEVCDSADETRPSPAEANRRSGLGQRHRNKLLRWPRSYRYACRPTAARRSSARGRPGR